MYLKLHTEKFARKKQNLPSKTKKQARFMAAAAHNSKFAKKVGISQGVAKEFNRADTVKKRKRK